MSNVLHNYINMKICGNGITLYEILSPELFSVYMDDLSNMLIRSGVGRYIEHVCGKSCVSCR